jgi:hypothetical protein
MILSCMEIIGRHHDRSSHSFTCKTVLPIIQILMQFSQPHSNTRNSNAHSFVKKHQTQSGDIAEVQQKKGDRRGIHSNDASQAISKRGKLPSHPAPRHFPSVGFLHHSVTILLSARKHCHKHQKLQEMTHKMTCMARCDVQQTTRLSLQSNDAETTSTTTL